MKKHSCGAILYTIYNNSVCVVLGMEKGQWFPFKGLREKGETNVEAAIREIREETCDAVHINTLELDCNYSTKRKHYHIGLHQITLQEIMQFFHNRYNNDFNSAYLEKEDIKLFPIDHIQEFDFHEITRIPIDFYYQYLLKLQTDIHINIMNRIRGSFINKFPFNYHNKHPVGNRKPHQTRYLKYST